MVRRKSLFDPGGSIGWMRLRSLLGGLLLALACGPGGLEPASPTGEGQAAFEALMEELARAWNAGDAAAAAACFTADAVYSEPPDRQLLRGRAALYEFFGGAEGRGGEMSMTWHHLAYRPETGIGFGEFSFTYGTTAHGVVVVRVHDGRIANWREYWYESELGREEFVASNPF